MHKPTTAWLTAPGFDPQTPDFSHSIVSTAGCLANPDPQTLRSGEPTPDFLKPHLNDRTLHVLTHTPAASAVPIQKPIWPHRERHFNIDAEFPRLFLPRAYHSRSVTSIPNEVLLQAKHRLEAALFSFFNRMIVTIADENAPTGFRDVRVIEHLRHVFKEKGLSDQIHFFATAGILRSTLGHFYEEMWQAYWRGEDPEFVLHRIALETHDVPLHKVRGVCSDFDFHLSSDKPDEILTAIHEAWTALSSAQIKLGITKHRNLLQFGVFPVWEVREYTSTISRWSEDGGSFLEYIGFDMSTGQFDEQPGIEGAVNDFLRGEYTFNKPKNPHVSYPIKLTVRALRELVELPFLQLKNKIHWRNEAHRFIQHLSLNEKFPEQADFEKAVSQIGKLIRNARLSGANNRLFRGKDGSIESLGLELIQDILKKADKSPIKEWVEYRPLHTSPQANSESDKIPTLTESFISVDEFLQNNTEDGVVYYVASNPEMSFALLRGNVAASENQSMQVFSSRFEASLSFETDAVIVPLSIRRDSNLKVVDVTKSPFNLQNNHFDLKQCGVDIIIENRKIRILNTAAIDFSDDPALLSPVILENIEEYRAQSLSTVETYAWVKKTHPHMDQIGFLKSRARKNIETYPELFLTYPWDFTDVDERALALLTLKSMSDIPWEFAFKLFSHLELFTENEQNVLNIITTQYLKSLTLAILDKSLTTFSTQEQVIVQALQMMEKFQDKSDAVASLFISVVMEYYFETNYLRKFSLHPWQKPDLIAYRQTLATLIAKHISPSNRATYFDKLDSDLDADQLILGLLDSENKS